jgi:hypothetical protein
MPGFQSFDVLGFHGCGKLLLTKSTVRRVLCRETLRGHGRKIIKKNYFCANRLN